MKNGELTPKVALSFFSWLSMVVFLVSLIPCMAANSCMAMAMPAPNYDTKTLGKDVFSKTVLRCKSIGTPFDGSCAEKVFYNETKELSKDYILELFSARGGKCNNKGENRNEINCSIYVYLKIVKVFIFSPDKAAGFDSFDMIYKIHFQNNLVSNVKVISKQRTINNYNENKKTQIGEDHGKL